MNVAVVGAGIVGLAHAYHLQRQGAQVTVFERGPRATGASIRNFGMIWPIGQPPGEMREIAMRSREVWREVLQASGIWHRESGSLHLAYHDDELDVLQEFVDLAPAYGYRCEIISANDAKLKSPELRTEGLRGAMWSADELCVFPRQVVGELPSYLESVGVRFEWASAVCEVGPGYLKAAGKTHRPDLIVLCTGDDFETLYPERFAVSGLTRSKLQMMRAKPKRADYRLGTHLCAGLTLGHYANFRICDRLSTVLDRYRNELPDHVRWGIHLLVSQHEDGQLTIGDSHEYGLAVDPFLRAEIDRLILEYLDTFLDVREFDITERWYGVYGKHSTKGYIHEEPESGVHVVTGVGGAGMTLSFGLAEKMVAKIWARRP